MLKLKYVAAVGVSCAALSVFIPADGPRAEGPHQDIRPTLTAQRTVAQDCREFQQTVIVAGQEVIASGVACLQPDGQWEVQSLEDYEPAAEGAPRAQDEPPPSASEVSLSTTGGLSSRGLSYDSGAGGMAVDGLFVRPISFVGTVLGSVLFVVTLPFSALSGNVEEAADTLVMEPARFTFTRCLGCWPKRF